jgi:hypothetical protein
VQVGNAVPPFLAKQIGEGLTELLKRPGFQGNLHDVLAISDGKDGQVGLTNFTV